MLRQFSLISCYTILDARELINISSIIVCDLIRGAPRRMKAGGDIVCSIYLDLSIAGYMTTLQVRRMLGFRILHWRRLQYTVASIHVNVFFTAGGLSQIWFLSHCSIPLIEPHFLFQRAFCLGWLQQTVSSPFAVSSANRKNTAEIRYQSLKRTSWLFVISNRSFVLTLEAILLLLSAADDCKSDSSWYLKAWGSFKWFWKQFALDTKWGG